MPTRRRRGASQIIYLALATDGDGTLTVGERLATATRRALERLRDTGRKLILATGETPHQLAGFPHVDLFDRVVARNKRLSSRCRSRRITQWLNMNDGMNSTGCLAQHGLLHIPPPRPLD
ncbi:MAG TPA: hypothetical protein VKE40_23480 [Gemmataceae bacterium]|nr:hypothetical protein [Gemmataceae bacterium]